MAEKRPEGGLDRETTALIVVDMQEFFVRPGSAFDRFIDAVFPASDCFWYRDQVERHVVPKIAGLIDGFRARGAPVLFTEFGSRTRDGSDFPPCIRRHNAMAVELIGEPCYPPLAAPESRVVGELLPVDGEDVVTKATSGPLAGTRLAETLVCRRISTVVVVGVATDVCVQGMARELADSGFEVYVCGDACATVGQRVHDATLYSLGTTFAHVVGTRELPAIT